MYREVLKMMLGVAISHRKHSNRAVREIKHSIRWVDKIAGEQGEEIADDFARGLAQSRYG